MAVPTGGDALRQERLTRDLYAALSGVEGLVLGYADDGDGPVADGRKGAGAGDVAAASRPASHVLITLIKEWCAKERHRKVEVIYDGHSVTLTGRPNADQERLVRDFLDRVTDDTAESQDEGSSAGGGAS
ncbi:hypothetical protein [Streptomyces sp. NPDC003023]|uniref:effector-associated constant component EACC1 n=1 Tax=Streptomyces sp. NPDC003023 TaxID=3364675 RepID=UPI0036C714D7